MSVISRISFELCSISIYSCLIEIFFSYTTYFILDCEDLSSHYASRLYKATASRTKSKVFFLFPFLLLSWEAPLKHPLSLVMSPPFSSGALLNHHHVKAMLLASCFYHKAQQCSAGSSVSAQSKAQNLLAPFCFMGVVI